VKQLISFALLLIFAVPATAITIDTVPVGDVGNPNDPTTGNVYGGVNYAYNIGKYEVTAGQYTAFLNAVAKADPYGLYRTSQLTFSPVPSSVITIEQTGSSPNYSYSVPANLANQPVTNVSWGDAARFVNWLANGQPTGAEGPGTTETGAYTLNGATTASALMAVSRNAGAKWFLPTENEWYKAAYYQPTAHGGDSDGYWTYPMKTNSLPYSDQPPGATPDNSRVGNFNADDGLANGYDDGFAVTGLPFYGTSQNYLTDVGAYVSSPSYYGTFDQGGNVFEWSETAVNADARSQRGGSWVFTSSSLQASVRNSTDPTTYSVDGGFRVASIPAPEPTSVLLAAVGVLLCGGLRRFR
jgi:sulfatase modifying factor 1